MAEGTIRVDEGDNRRLQALDPDRAEGLNTTIWRNATRLVEHDAEPEGLLDRDDHRAVCRRDEDEVISQPNRAAAKAEDRARVGDRDDRAMHVDMTKEVTNIATRLMDRDGWKDLVDAVGWKTAHPVAVADEDDLMADRPITPRGGVLVPGRCGGL